MTVINIKNMVCDRCLMVVRQELEKLDLHPEKISLGEARVLEDLSAEQFLQIDSALKAVGFERIDDRKTRLVEDIKNRIIHRIHHSDQLDLKVNWSALLAEEMHYEYNYLSTLFSATEGITLEQYIIRQKIEKVKELISYDELTLSQIADRLGYSSVSHLSAQFKKVAGVTPSELKRSNKDDQARKPLDLI